MLMPPVPSADLLLLETGGTERSVFLLLLSGQGSSAGGVSPEGKVPGAIAGG